MSTMRRTFLEQVTKGDVAGHEFHGNQYTSGSGNTPRIAMKQHADLAAAHRVQQTNYAEDTPPWEGHARAVEAHEDAKAAWGASRGTRKQRQPP